MPWGKNRPFTIFSTAILASGPKPQRVHSPVFDELLKFNKIEKYAITN
jgi:hypothetical protein